ncbi:MAG: hypothetical protein US54_C0079G0014 [Candidatus Roizmanbacteria bacterium GW2011_GWA2_37_7]|uniref:Uncharacterized protein n=1 Tax=Candidatus Roizmanbacteria bacterium GW2011_GWA2_37_7 TaxID=1618481 RepID=A0A0G0GYX5_9BACT|nr:MAG: hypothetical protein US54_C0079G0014 [Candidatus Roizmanbacteria bacterium GW2011_GWA2_37_7]
MITNIYYRSEIFKYYMAMIIDIKSLVLPCLRVRNARFVIITM